MTSSPFDSTHGRTTSGVACHHRLGSTYGRTTSGVACHHRLLAAQMVERRRAWHPIVAFGLAHTVGGRRMWHAIRDLGQHTRSNDVRCGIPSWTLDNTHGRTTSGVAFHQRLWAAHSVERHRGWHDIIAHGRQTRSNDVGRDMPSPPLESTHGWITSGVGCHHRPRTAHTVGRRRAWHDITALGLHAWSAMSGVA